MGKRYGAKDRERLVEAVRKSGESIRAVAARMGVKEATAYFWMKRARQSMAPAFARVVPSRREPTTALRVEVSGAIILLESGFDAQLLREVVSALSRQPV